MFFATAYIIAIIFIFLLVATFMVHAFYLIPYVPSRKKVVNKMIEVAKLKHNDTVVDLGCGDGRLLFAAENISPKIKGVGFEVAPLVYALAWILKTIKKSKSKLHFKSLFHADLRKANVIFCYLFPSAMTKLAKKIQTECKPGTRIVSNTFHIPNLTLVKKYPPIKSSGLPPIYVYTV